MVPFVQHTNEWPFPHPTTIQMILHLFAAMKMNHQNRLYNTTNNSKNKKQNKSIKLKKKKNMPIK